MSAAGRGGARAALDFYSTPAWVTETLLAKLENVPEGSILDPCAGDGSILRLLGERGYGFELDPERAAKCRESGLPITNRDALSDTTWTDFADKPPAAVIMNPPYSLSEAFVRRALSEVRPGGTVAVLLRLGWLASKKRVPFHRSFPSAVYVLPRRPSFTPDGKTDASEYAWFVWPGQGTWSVLDAPEPVKRTRKGKDTCSE